jgi:hypothetical protein
MNTTVLKVYIGTLPELSVVSCIGTLEAQRPVAELVGQIGLKGLVFAPSHSPKILANCGLILDGSGPSLIGGYGILPGAAAETDPRYDVSTPTVPLLRAVGNGYEVATDENGQVRWIRGVKWAIPDTDAILRDLITAAWEKFGSSLRSHAMP